MSSVSISYFELSFLNYVILFIDIAAGIVIGIAVLRVIVKFLVAQKKSPSNQNQDLQTMKGFLVSNLIIGIDLEVGADVLRTILVPSLNDLLALSVVVALRVVLNWSLSE